MPYLADPERRGQIARDVEDMHVDEWDAAELNFAICTMLSEFTRGMHGRSFSYARINEAMGAATLAPLEWWRRVVGPYEDSKALSNGDLPWHRG